MSEKCGGNPGEQAEGAEKTPRGKSAGARIRSEMGGQTDNLDRGVVFKKIKQAAELQKGSWFPMG